MVKLISIFYCDIIQDKVGRAQPTPGVYKFKENHNIITSLRGIVFKDGNLGGFFPDKEAPKMIFCRIGQARGLILAP
jgi:hypothetical protein